MHPALYPSFKPEATVGMMRPFDDIYTGKIEALALTLDHKFLPV
jgi:hypothetical protein